MGSLSMGIASVMSTLSFLWTMTSSTTICRISFRCSGVDVKGGVIWTGEAGVNDVQGGTVRSGAPGLMVEGMSTREAARVFGLHRDTVRKMLEYSAPEG